jgi:IS605 OrfB family transposase
MGVANPLTRSDGHHVRSHQGHDITAHLARLERRKLRAKRQYARKLHAAAERAGAVTATGAFKKGVRIETSNRMRRLVDRINKIDRQIVGYRADWQRKQALAIVKRSEIVVVEDLTIRNMTRSAAGTAEAPGRNVRAKAGLNRAILARGWGSMRQRLKNKADELGGRVVEVNPAYTSQTCPECDHTHQDNRKTQAEFSCTACGFTEHADIVGATNILARGMSAGVQPVAERRGLATVAAPSGADDERAVEALNKPSREPEASSKSASGSRGAKPHTACNELATQAHDPHQHGREVIDPENGGSRNAGP